MINKEHFLLLSKVSLTLAVGSTMLAFNYGGLAIAQAVASDVLFPAAVLTCWMIGRKATSVTHAATHSALRSKLRQVRIGRK